MWRNHVDPVGRLDKEPPWRVVLRAPMLSDVGPKRVSPLIVETSAGSTLPITGFVICQDEEPTIVACLRSLSRCREIVVVDSGSTDSTVALIEALRDAEGLPIRLLHQPWLGYAAQKQFALDQATQPWCLSLDADERLDEAAQASLDDLIAAGPEVGGWLLGRLPSRMGDFGPPPRSVYAKPILRLVRREGTSFDAEALVHEGMRVPGTVRVSRTGLIRHERVLPFADQITKELTYARLKARERVLKGRRPSVLRLLANPALYFFRLYVLHRWFLCGRPGLVHAVTGAIYAVATEAMHFDEYAARSEAA